MSVPCVIYAAKSSPDEKGSVADQQRVVLEAVGLEGGRFVVAEPFGEQNVSGYLGERGAELTAAMAAATRAAEEHGEAELWIFHSSRLARGDGTKGRRSLLKIYADLLYENVRIRSVSDNEFVTNGMLVGVASDQNNKYAKDVSAHVVRGYDAANREGRPIFSIVPDGYMYVYPEDPVTGRPNRRPTMRKEAERREIFDLMFALGLDGYSDAGIVPELDSRGFMTRPRKRTHAPRPFDRNRVGNTLGNPTYAGLVVRLGKVVGPGRWEPYIDPDDFARLQEMRAARWGVKKAPRGRPPEGYLLARLVRCGECGAPLHVQTGHSRRRDGTYPRRYVCRTHRDRPMDCAVKPFDADAIDGSFAEHLDAFLADVEGWRERLVSDRRAEVSRMRLEVDRAGDDARAAVRRLETARRRYDAALDAGDEERAATIEDAMTGHRRDQRRAETRMEAARSALGSATAEASEIDPDAALDVLRRELTERTASAGDVKRMNLVLRDFFEAVTLTHEEDGVRVEPAISATAAERIVANLGVDQDRVRIVGAAGHQLRLTGETPETLSFEVVDPANFPDPETLWREGFFTDIEISQPEPVIVGPSLRAMAPFVVNVAT